MPFTTKEQSKADAWKPRTTALLSAAISREWSQKIRDEAIFGARITQKAYVDAIKKNLVEIIGGAITPVEAEMRLKETLRDLGYSPERGFGDGKVPPARAGDIRDLSSSRRIQLILDTNVKRARSMGQAAASEDPVLLMADPAWELTRTGARKKPRGDWRKRWAAAGAQCGWEGAVKRRMVALKTSPIWQALADGSGGFTDTLGSPFPPFAFGSGLAWVNVGRREWKRLCEAEGVPDGLEAITDKARELKRRREEGDEEAHPVKIDIAFPDMGDKPKGVENPLSAPVPPPKVPAPAKVGYAADFTRRDEANNVIDDALDEVGRYLKDAEKWRDEEAGTEDGMMLAEAAIELRSLKGRIGNYGGSIGTTPIPRNRYEQASYDLAMDRLARAAKATAKAAKKVYARMRGEAGL